MPCSCEGYGAQMEQPYPAIDCATAHAMWNELEHAINGPRTAITNPPELYKPPLQGYGGSLTTTLQKPRLVTTDLSQFILGD